MTTGSNCVTWKGGDKHSGLTKNTLATQILEVMKEKGIKAERTCKDVINKTSHMESNFKKAVDFSDGTGAGIEDEKSLKEAILKRCPCCCELEPVMSDRSAVCALANEEDSTLLDDKNDDDDDLSNSMTSSRDTTTNDSAASEKKTTPPLHLSANKRKRKKNSNSHEDTQQCELIQLRRDMMQFEQANKRMEMEQRQMEANTKEREARALTLKMKADVAKIDAECERILLDNKVATLMKRNELKNAGVPIDEIDAMIPIVRATLHAHDESDSENESDNE